MSKIRSQVTGLEFPFLFTFRYGNDSYIFTSIHFVENIKLLLANNYLLDMLHNYLQLIERTNF